MDSLPRRWLILGLGLGCAWLPAEGVAQAVRGLVVDASDGGAISGAMVGVLEPTGKVAGRALTDAEGRFEARVLHPGSYQARVERIGYESTTTARFEVPPEGTFQRIAVPVRPVRLEGLDVSGSKRCEVRPEVGHATARAWEEARKALDAARWTSEAGRYSYTLLHFARRWDSGGRRILEEKREFLDRLGRAPYASVAAEDLVSQGFATEVFADYLSYFAPDASVLLSDAFLDTHCMRTRHASDGKLALDFEPVEGRTLPEIEGTIWLDAATAELRSVEYRYVNLGLGRVAGRADGELTFERLGDGAWFVADWHVRMPLVAPGRAVRRARIGYEDKGGTVWRALDSSGATVYRAVTGRITGVVRDSTGTPLAGVTLIPRGLDARAVSGPDGRFALEEMPEGLVRLDAIAPHLDTLGLETLDTAPVTVLAKGGSSAVNVRIPGVRERLRSFCGGRGRTGTSVLLGRVEVAGRSPEGAIVSVGRLSGSGGFRAQEQATPPGGGVRSRWDPVGNTPWWEARLDGRGLFLLCEVPAHSVVRVAARLGEEVAEADITVEPGDPVIVFTLHLPHAPGANEVRAAGGARTSRGGLR